MKVNFNFTTGCLLVALLGSGCATARYKPFGGACALPMRPDAKEYTCKHCNCIMQVAEGEWQHTCNVCNCKKTFKDCL